MTTSKVITLFRSYKPFTSCSRLRATELLANPLTPVPAAAVAHLPLLTEWCLDPGTPGASAAVLQVHHVMSLLVLANKAGEAAAAVLARALGSKPRMLATSTDDP